MTLGTGAAVTNSRTYAALQFEAGQHFSFIDLSAGYVACLSRRADAGADFYFKFGKRIQATETVYVLPSAGYSYLLRDQDIKEVNRKGVVYGIELGMQTGLPQASVFIAGNVNKDIQSFTVGMRFSVQRFSDRYCH